MKSEGTAMKFVAFSLWLCVAIPARAEPPNAPKLVQEVSRTVQAELFDPRPGWLVGKPTAGAVQAGRPDQLSAGGVLYLAVADVRIDGERLEGHPVHHDLEVDRPLAYSHGADPQLEAALRVLFRPLP